MVLAVVAVHLGQLNASILDVVDGPDLHAIGSDYEGMFHNFRQIGHGLLSCLQHPNAGKALMVHLRRCGMGVMRLAPD